MKAIITIVCFAAAQPAFGAIGLLSWGHSGLALEGYPEDYFHVGPDPMGSPFAQSRHARDLNTTLDVDYFFTHGPAAGQFSIDSAHHVENSLHEGAAWAWGGFAFQPTSPVEITLASQIDFDVPTIGFEASNYMRVLRYEAIGAPPQTLWSGWIGSYNTPGAGSESMFHSLAIGASNAIIEIEYSLLLAAEAEAPTSAIADASASLNLSVLAVPEPSPAALLAIGILATKLGRRQRSAMRGCGHRPQRALRRWMFDSRRLGPAPPLAPGFRSSAGFGRVR